MKKYKWFIVVAAALLIAVGYLMLQPGNSGNGEKNSGKNKIALVEVQKVKR